MKKLLLSAAAVAGAMAVVPALAQTGTAAPMAGKTHTRAEMQAKVAEHFAKVDTNRDGVITRAEADSARTAMRGKMREHMGKRMASGKAHAGGHDGMFERLDTNQDGSISRQEFDSGHARMAEKRGTRMERRGHAMHMGAMRGKMFEMADVNKDGQVTLQEAQGAALRHFDMMDSNRDGQITPDERRQMRQRMHGCAKPG